MKKVRKCIQTYMKIKKMKISLGNVQSPYRKHSDVYHLNNIIMDRLSGESCHMKSADSIAETNQATLYSTEFLNSLSISGMPPHHIDRVKRIWYLSPMRAAKVQASAQSRQNLRCSLIQAEKFSL